jgi:tetratricopeptide (TPR) repeat protein
MKPRSQFVASLLLASSFMAAGTFANPNNVGATSLFAFQQGPGRGPIAVPRDPETEKQSYKSLDAAKFYFYKRKPDKKDKDAATRSNKAIIDRLQEIVDTNPNFARIDEVYFLLGEVHNRGGDTDKAIEFWTKASKDSSDEKIKAEAQKRLDEANIKSKKG